MGLSGAQILIIVVVFMVLFLAPSRLPSFTKSVAQAIRGFKKAMTEDDDTTDVTESVKREKLDRNETEPVSSQSTESEKQKDKV